MAKTLAERLRDCAHGVSLGADGMGWSPDPALLEEAADKIVSLHAELQHARDGLTKGRSRMREDNERLRAALRQLVDAEDMRLRLRQLHEMGHGTDYTDYHRLLPMAWAAAREALGPNAAGNRAP
jgi:hypothetical protein